MSIVLKAGRFVSLGVAAFVLGSCTVAVDEGPRPLPPRPGAGPQMCTMEHAPVCGERRDRRQTFSNSCMARAEGFRVVHNGECRSSGWRPTPPPQTRPGTRPDQRACTREFRPVCGQRGNRMQTFPNACEADRANFRVISRGQCEQQSRRR